MSAFVVRSGRATALATRHFHTGLARAGGGAINQPVPWNYLWKPGPYPETESARIAAAKKYGLIVEDYKPYPKGSDVMAGDYPDLPLVPEFNRARLYEWDFPEFRRDYGEPLHEDWDMYRETRFTPHTGQRYSLRQQQGFLLCLFIFFGTTFYITECTEYVPKYFRPHMELQRIKDGPHYTFEPLD